MCQPCHWGVPCHLPSDSWDQLRPSKHDKDGFGHLIGFIDKKRQIIEYHYQPLKFPFLKKHASSSCLAGL